MKREEGSGPSGCKNLGHQQGAPPSAQQSRDPESQLVAAEGLPGDEGRGGVSRGSCTWVCNLEPLGMSQNTLSERVHRAAQQ